MDTIRKFLEENIEEHLQQMVLSDARDKTKASKSKVRPVLLKGQVYYQVSETQGTKEIHHNYNQEELLNYLCSVMQEQFKQLQMESSTMRASILVSKKGKITIKSKKMESQDKEVQPVLSHNRKKSYILEEGKPVAFLIDLGVMNAEGKVLQAKYDKFKQLNRFLEFIEDILPKLPKDKEVTILDFGCGKSYLTFAMYHYLKELKGYDVNIIGLDLKEDVIAACSQLAQKYQYDKLHFYQGDIASYEGVRQVDMVVTLHACDTATDYALAKAVAWNAEVILSVPCCQHELNAQIENELLNPIFSYGILKERFAALLTDGLRAKMLESAGYDTQILEFIDMEHTPKNLLIRAVKRADAGKGENTYRQCMEFFHVNPTLEQLLSAGKEAVDEENLD